MATISLNNIYRLILVICTRCVLCDLVGLIVISVPFYQKFKRVKLGNLQIK